MKLEGLKWNADGLIPAIVQEGTPDGGGGRVLMMAWMNHQAIEKTLETGHMHYWSRSRQKSWFKGESSGHTQKVLRWFVDCDADTLLFHVEQTGGACHTGHRTCFFQPMDASGNRLEVSDVKVFDPEQVYSS